MVEDMFTWTATGLGTDMLSDELAAQRLELSTNLGEPGFYGMGIMELPPLPGWIGHTGQALGWEAIALYEPATGATFAAIVNSTGGLITALLR